MVFKSKVSLKSQLPLKPEEPERPVSPKLKKSGGSKSPSRRKSPSRTTSPTRSKSPARKSPSRKSPARSRKDVSSPPLSSTLKVPTPKARSPIRRSPSRKSPPRIVKTSSKSVNTNFTGKAVRSTQIKLDADTDSDNPEIDQIAEKPQATVRGRARRLEVQVEKLEIKDSGLLDHGTFNVVKRVTRNSQNRELERVVHLKHFDQVTTKLGEFSDEDDIVQIRKSESVDRGLDFKQITEFGGSWGALFLMVVGPLSITAMLISCNEYQCSFIHPPNLSKYAILSTYFHLTSVLSFLGYATLLAILSVVPFGGKKVAGMITKQGKFFYRMNGLFSCFVLIAIAIVLEFRGIPVTDFVVEHIFQLFITSVLFGLLLSIYVYIRSFYVPLSSLNVHVIDKNGIYGFFMGRELNPRFFGILDLKMYAFRLAAIGSVLLDFAYIYKSWGSISQDIFDLKSLNINPTLVVLVVIHSIYFLDGLANETSWVTSFEIQYEGFGYMSGIGYLIYPFVISAITKYVFDYEVQLAIWKLILINFVFLFGFLLYRGSNNQKDAFRKNPYDPALSHLATIPTTKGKKLICSGFWGIVRHPNYLGDILMNLTFASFALQVPPVIGIVAIITLLIHRSVRDNVRCKQKYGAAWDRYCSKVKYILLPKVY